MLSLFKENTDTKDLIKNIRRVCSPLEFENIQKELKQEAQKSVSLQFHYDRALDKLWRKRAKEIFLDIETASPQDILIRAGHIFRPKFQCLVKNMATRFKSNDKKATPNKQELEFKIRSGDKNPFRMRQKESNPAESCFGRPEKHTDILAGMVFPNTNKMMEAFVDYFAPANNSIVI